MRSPAERGLSSRARSAHYGIAALAIAALAAGCSGEVTDLSVTISVDEGSCLGPDAETDWLPCGGRLGVWLLSEDGEVRDEACVPFAAEPMTVSDLPGLLRDVRFDGLGEGDRVAIEIAVYSEQVGDTCPRFNADNGTDVFPAYFGRSELVSLSGSTDPFTVTLSCFELVTDPCVGPPPVQISAAISNMDTWEPLVTEQPEISVTAGTVTEDGTYMELAQLDGQGPEWTGTIDALPTPDSCLGVAVTAQDAAPSFLSCESDASEPELVMAQGYFLEPALLESILAAFGPEQPTDTGLGLGRVVTMDNQPVAGVQIAPSDPALTIHYLSEDMMSIDDTATASHGYFLVSGEGPGCCYELPEVEPQGAAEVHPFGLAPGFVTMIPVRVQP